MRYRASEIGLPKVGVNNDFIFTSFGDSITTGFGATSGFIERLATSTGLDVVNAGVNSSRLVDAASTLILRRNVGLGSNWTMLPGFNDMRRTGLDADNLAAYQNILLSCAAWLSIPTTDRISGPDARLAFTGTWTPQTLYSAPFSNSNATAENAASVTAKLKGTTVYIGYTNRAGIGDGGTVTVNIDGTDIATIDQNAGAMEGFTYWPETLRISALANRNHTVILTANIGVGETCNIDWFSDNSRVGTFGYPHLFMGNTLRMNATGYAAGTPTWDHGSDEAVTAFNLAALTVTNQLVADGLFVHTVNASAAYDPDTQAQADNIHPDDTAHAAIAAAFDTSMSGVVC